MNVFLLRSLYIDNIFKINIFSTDIFKIETNLEKARIFLQCKTIEAVNVWTTTSS